MAQIGRLKRSLEPIDEQKIAGVLKALMERGWKLSADIDPRKAARLYFEVIGSKGAGPIKAVAEKMTRGEYDFCDKGFLPIPAYFARLCDAEHEAIRASIVSLKRADRRRDAIWNRLPDSWNNRQREEHIDALLSELDCIDAEAAE